MAGDALQVADFVVVKPRRRRMTRGALLRERCMGRGQVSGRVHAAIRAKAITGERNKRQRGRRNRKQELPTAQRKLRRLK